MLDFVLELLISFTPSLILFCLVILWLFYFLKHKHLWVVLVCSVVLIISLFSDLKSTNWQTKTTKDKEEDVLSFLSLNIHYKNKKYDEIVNIIHNESPDIVNLIEVQDEHEMFFDEKLGEIYPYKNSTYNSLDFARNKIYSKYEIVSSNQLDFNDFGSVYAIKFIKGNKLVNFVSVHTTAPISNKLFALRNKQLSNIVEVVNAYPFEEDAIVVGDFNVTKYSKFFPKFNTLHNISNLPSMTCTWFIFKMPLMCAQIDHAFVSEGFNLYRGYSVNISGSDHKGLYFELTAN